MFYKFLNKQISNKISELHPIAVRYLSDDIEKNNNETIAERLKVVRNHALIHKYYETDQKRLYMVNRNYLNFLKAIIFLYKTSRVSVFVGTPTAPTEIYHTINAVQQSFKEMVKLLSLDSN